MVLCVSHASCASMWPIVTDEAWSVCVSVGFNRELCKWMNQSRCDLGVEQRNHVLDRVWSQEK